MKNTIFPSTTTRCRSLAGENKPRAEPTCSHPWGDTAHCPTSSRAPCPRHTACSSAHRDCVFLLFPKRDTQSWQIKPVPNNRTQTTTAKCLRCRVGAEGFTFPPSIPPRDMQVILPLPQEAVPFQHTAQDQCWVTARNPASQTLASSCQEALARLFLGTKEEQVENEPHRQTAAFHPQEFILSRKRRTSFLSKHVGLQLCSHLAVLPGLWGTTHGNSRAQWGWFGQFDFRTPILLSCLENDI